MSTLSTPWISWPLFDLHPINCGLPCNIFSQFDVGFAFVVATEAMAEYVTAIQSPTISPSVQLGGDLKQPLVAAAPTQPQTSPLPPGWLEMEDPSGRTLYCNPTTGTTSWERPVIRRLPPGWMKSQTPDGKTIFIHPETQRCSYQFPSLAQAPMSQPQPQPQAVQMPQIARHTTAPGRAITSQPPTLVRSQTAPVQQPQDPSLVAVTVNTAMARKAVPGFGEALAVHQLSERNNSTVLTKKFASDLALTTAAMKDATISGASLATRQAKVAGQIMVDPKKMQKMSKKMVVKTGAIGVKTGRALKSMMGEMVDAADKKGKYQPKHRQFVPYDGQLEYQAKVPIQRPSPASAQTPEKVHEYEYQQQHALTSQLQQNTIPSPSHFHVAATPITTTTGVPARKPVRPQSITVNSNLALTHASQIENPVMANHPPGSEAVPQSLAHAISAETNDQQTLEFQIEVGGSINHNTSYPVAQQSTWPQPDTNEPPQICASVNPSSQLVPQKPLQIDSSLASGHLAGQHSATNTELRPQPLRPSKPSVAPAHQNSANSYSLQAQGSVTIQASVETSSPPSYTQAVQSYQPPASSQTALHPPPRQQAAPSASHPPPPTMYPQHQLNPQYGGQSPEQGTLLLGTTASGAVGYQVYNVVQPESGVMVYQDTQTMAYTSQPLMLAPQEQNIIIEQNQTVIQQQQVVNNETVVVQQQAMASQEYEVYVQQDMAYTPEAGGAEMEMYAEYTTYGEGVPGEETMYVEEYSGEVYGEVEYEA